MALVKTLSMERRPLMLKDYLKDDLSSCSSSGFKSFPRRQCCTTVRFLLEIDLKTKDYNDTKQLLQRSRSKAAAFKAITVLQRASGALLSAVKLIPFPSVKSPPAPVQQTQSQRRKKGLALPRSFSRKLLKRSFWRKANNEKEGTIKRCKIFREYLEEQLQPSDQITANLTPKRESNNSWAESDFTADVLHSSSGNSESSSENDAVEVKKNLPSSDKKPVSSNNTVGVSVGEDSITNSEENIKDWQSEEEKELFSPLSVLDYPFEDEKDSDSPPLEHRLARVEGTKQKLMQKLRRFESLAQLEPIDLEKRIASFQLDDKLLESSVQSFENETAKQVQELLKLMKSTSSSNGYDMCKAESLLSDFFREKIAENKAKTGRDFLKEAGDWINGHPQELLQRWEVRDGRNAYVNEMEKNGRWSDVNEEEKQEVGLALELGIFTRLMDEFVLDLSSSDSI